MTDPPALLPGSLSEGVQRGVRFRLGCPSRDVMRHVTSRWGVPILIALQGGLPRFGELRRKVSGVSERMLAQTLQSRESDGLGDRRAFPVVPPHVEYSLKPLGREAAAKSRVWPTGSKTPSSIFGHDRRPPEVNGPCGGSMATSPA